MCASAASAFVCEGSSVPADAGLSAPGASPAGPGAPAAKQTTAPLSWTAVPCHGPHGCGKALAASGASGADECDDTVATPGDPCPRSPPPDYACTSDHARALVCQGGAFALWRECRGGDGCQIEGGRNVRCDTTLAQVGDPCGQSGTVACSPDRQTMLACDGARMAAASSCRGPKGCQIERDSGPAAGVVACDDSVAQTGDPCDQEGRIACAPDRKAELACTHGRYDRKRECRRTDCRVDGNDLFCD